MSRSLRLAACAAVGAAYGWALLVECLGVAVPPDGWWCFGTEPAALPRRLLFLALLAWLVAAIDRITAWLGRVGTELERERDRRVTGTTLALLVATGFALRLPDLGVPALNWDEAMFAWVGANRTFADVWSSVAARSPHPPAYFFLLHQIMEWSWDPFWLRLPSVLAGSALIGVSFAFARRLVGVPGALLVATIVTFAPTLVELSRVARNYAMAFVCIVAAATFFLRFVQEGRWRDAVAASAAGFAALLFHYCFLVVAAAQYLQLAWSGLRHRRPPRWWLSLAASQALTLAGIAALYAFHIRQLNPRVASNHEELFTSVVQLVHNDWLAPLAGVWRYLVPVDYSSACLVAWFVGLGMMFARGMNVAFLSCVLPVLIAYLLSWTGRYPFYGSRHSAYLFPFLFGPFVVAAMGFASGGRWLPAWNGAGREAPAGFSGSRPGWPVRAGLVAVALASACFVDAAIEEYHQPPLDAAGRPVRVREFLTDYRRDDVDRAFAILEERVRPDDVVLLTRQSLYEFRYHYRLRPSPPVPIGEEDPADFLAGPVPEKLGFRDAGGVRFYYSPITGSLFRWLNASTVLEAYEQIRDTYRLRPGGSLWVIRSGWDVSYSRMFANQQPGVPVDEEVTRETGDVLFRIDGPDLLRACGVREMIRRGSLSPPRSMVPMPPR